MTVRTRFAPSPTGFLHLGGARTALFTWAFARHYGGTFVLRIEDTDRERSTPEAVQAILESMKWLGLEHDEGPYFQTQRMERYQAVIAQMLKDGSAYYCYSSIEELEEMREACRLRGEKPRYNGTWRPEVGKKLPSVPENRQAVVRFKNPLDGVVTWDDAVKGVISIANSEMDDLIIARADGSPTYNFCVVVDDWDMKITHVTRGDDHVNNTPRQINILKSLGAAIPVYAHIPMILGNDGEKLSKRHGAVSVIEYQKDYLPEAMLNYLARLGFGHGDDEIFSMEQFSQWFDLSGLSRSPAQFSFEKLSWVNTHYLKQADNQVLATIIKERWNEDNFEYQTNPQLGEVIALMKGRVSTLTELASACQMFYQPETPAKELWELHFNPQITEILQKYRFQLDIIDWDITSLSLNLKNIVTQHQLKMPQLAIPLRLLLLGNTQTPSIDAVQMVLGRQITCARIDNHLNKAKNTSATD